MQGFNAVGRSVSLLNELEEPKRDPAGARPPSIKWDIEFRWSSYNRFPKGYMATTTILPLRHNSKKSHPCPMSKQKRCDGLFTTASHATRHAKIHLNKKDNICPECSKGFGRKDNMGQHRKRRHGVPSVREVPSDTKTRDVPWTRPSPIQKSSCTRSVWNDTLCGASQGAHDISVQRKSDTFLARTDSPAIACSRVF